VTVKPYASKLLNMFDVMILHLMIVVSMLPLVDSFDQDLLVTFIFILVLLPIGAFLNIETYLYKQTIKQFVKNCFPSKPNTTIDNNETPMEDFVDSVIDDYSRRNVTIFGM